MSKKQAIVSIIAPAFNAESTLKRCVKSLLRQTYENIEIIIINDGSTDKTAEICQAYHMKDRRIQVIHQPNAGPAAARNRGIHVAKGDYLQFVDADDFIEKDMTEKLLKCAQLHQADLVICGYYAGTMHEDFSMETILPSLSGGFTRDSFLMHVGKLYRETIIPSPCNKLYKTEVIRAHQLQFPENLTLGEDLLFNVAFLHVAEQIAVTQEALYYYITGEKETLSTSYIPNYFTRQLSIYQKIVHFLKENDAYGGENKKAMDAIFTNSLMNGFQHVCHEQSDLSKKKQLTFIHDMMTHPNTLEAMRESSDKRLQTKLLKRLLHHQNARGVRRLVQVKQKLNKYSKPIYERLKKINNV